MLDHRDLADVVMTIVTFKSKYGYGPTLEECSKSLNLSLGSLEHRIRMLKAMGFIKDTHNRPLALVDEGYVPPHWIAILDQAIYDKLPIKHRKNAKEKSCPIN